MYIIRSSCPVSTQRAVPGVGLCTLPPMWFPLRAPAPRRSPLHTQEGPVLSQLLNCQCSGKVHSVSVVRVLKEGEGGILLQKRDHISPMPRSLSKNQAAIVQSLSNPSKFSTTSYFENFQPYRKVESPVQKHPYTLGLNLSIVNRLPCCFISISLYEKLFLTI